MNGVNGIWPLVWERLLASWRMLAVLGFGVLVAATLLAASPIYTRVMNDLGLQQSLQEQIGSAGHNTLFDFGAPFGSETAADNAGLMAALLSEEIGWFTESEARYGAVGPFTLGRAGRPLSEDPLRRLVTLQTLSGFEEHVRVVEGSLPQPASDPGRIEVAIAADAAALLHINAGDRFGAGFIFDDCNRPPPTNDPEQAAAQARFACVPQTFVTLVAPLTVTAIIEADDRDDPIWSAGAFSFLKPELPEEASPTVPFLMPEQSFYQALPLLLPGVPSEYRYTGYVDLTRLDAGNIDRARASLAALRTRANDAGFAPDLSTARALDSFARRASFNQITLLLLLLQVVGIAVYYVLLVSSLLVERRAEETAMLRSRGASVLQIVALAALEASAMGLIAALAAPFLAAAVIAALGKTGTFASVSGGGFLDFVLVPAAFLFGLGGATLAVIAVVVPSFFGARRGLVLFLRSAARPGKPLIQRYYIDVALVGLAALALWELNQRGSVFDPRSVGGWSADPLLLLSPLLLIFAVSGLLFRFLPLILQVVGRIVAATAGPGVTLGVWQLTRRPARYTQLALLVIMAAAVGTFAATYGATTERSQEERARFQAGVDVRTTGLGRLKGQGPAAIRHALNDIPGVEESAAAHRGNLALGPIRGFRNTVQVLGIDPKQVGTEPQVESLLWFRSDFADEDLATLMRRLVGSPAGGAGLVLPGEPVGVSLSAEAVPPREPVTLWLRTVDVAGVFRLTQFGDLGSEGPQRFTLRFQNREAISYPIAIVALILTQAPNSESPPGNLIIDDIAALDAAGEETVVEDFEGALRWSALPTASLNRDAVTRTQQTKPGGAVSANFEFLLGTSVSMRGIYVTDPNLPLPALASGRLLDRLGAPVGAEIELIVGTTVLPVSIQSRVALFPTLPDSQDGFLILNQERLFFFAQMANQPSPNHPTEAWLRLSEDPALRADAMREINARHGILPAQMLDLQRALEEARTDPIVKAGGSGVLLIALVAAAAILALGFGLTLYLGGQNRTLEVSVLRAVGLSPAQIFAMISLEYLLIAAIGLAAGTLAGLRIAATMLSFLNVTADGARVVPPFALVTNWDTVAIAFAAMGVAFLAGVLVLALYFLRLPMSRILRLTQ